MDENAVANQIWETRQATMRTCLNVDKLSPALLSYGLEHEKQETLFFLKHQQHGTVVLRHESIEEERVELSEEFRSWTRSTEEGECITWKYILVCSCGEFHVIVDDETPDEFRGI